LTSFPEIKFRGQLRPSQAAVCEVAKKQLSNGEQQLHIVAPPGSGKTVLGLYLWAEMVKRPALVLSPNSAIQSQWAARTDLFQSDPAVSTLVSTSSDEPRLLTSLTYQAVTLPRRGDASLDDQAMLLWKERLIEAGQALDPIEAEVWIRDLKRNNPNYYDDRLSSYRKHVRDEAGQQGASFEMLHHGSIATWNRLREIGIGMLILDECHHLVGHWGRVLSDAMQHLDEPLVVGLTATPPDGDGKSAIDFNRYQEFLGPIDHDVPVPAVVRDGFLSPYQDLAYFVRPTDEELRFVANADDRLHDIVKLVCEKENASAEIVEPIIEELEFSDEPDIDEEGEFDDFLDNLQVVGSTDAVFEQEQDDPTPEQAKTSDQDAEVPADDEAPPLPGLVPWLLKRLGTLTHAGRKFKTWSSFHRRDPEFIDAARAFLQSRAIQLPENAPPLATEVPLSDLPEVAIVIPILDRYVRHGLRRSANPDDQKLAQQIVSGLRLLGVQITETGCQACVSPVGRVLAYSQQKSRALTTILATEMDALGDTIRAVVVTDFEKSSATVAEIEHLLDSEAGGAIAAFRSLVNDETTDELNPILVTGSTVLVDDDLSEAFHEAAKNWLKENQCQAKLNFEPRQGYHVVTGQGRDWCPRVYVQMITELFQQGLTQCLVGTRGLLGEGWDANKINVLIDLTTVTTSMTVRQLRGRSFRLDPQMPTKLANNWDVVCIAPEFSKGLDDYARFIKKHKNIFGVTDDSVIEKGVGHVHPALTDLRPELLEGSVAALNDDMLSRVAQRDHVRDLWKIGVPYQGIPTPTLELRIPDEIVDAGGFPPFSRTNDPWSADSLVQSIGEVIARSMIELDMISRNIHVLANNRAGGYVRAMLDDATEAESKLFVAALHETLGPLNRPRYVVPRLLRYSISTWLSRMLPTMFGKYFEQERLKTVMYHTVPSSLARKKETVEVFQRYWNRLVSPGEAVYALRGEGEDIVKKALETGLSPQGEFHSKEVFN